MTETRDQAGGTAADHESDQCGQPRETHGPLPYREYAAELGAALAGEEVNSDAVQAFLEAKGVDYDHTDVAEVEALVERAAAAGWDCEAYGPEGREYGALCFFSEGARVCGSLGECSERMAGERGRVFGRIRELAEAGDPVGEYLAGEFTSPEQLLGGGEESPVPPSRQRGATSRASTPTFGFRAFGDDGRHPAEAEGWTPPVVSGGVYHDFVAGGDDATFGAAGTWCAVWVGEGDQADQCGRPREAHRSGLSLAEAVRRATEAGGRAVARLECGPGVADYLRSIASDMTAPPWRPAPIVPLAAVPVVGDDTLPAGRWRMVDAAGAVVWEGTVEQPGGSGR